MNKNRPDMPWAFAANVLTAAAYRSIYATTSEKIADLKSATLAAVMEEASRLPPLQETKRKGGRPKVEVRVEEIQKWRSVGYSYADVAEKYLTSISTIKRRLRNS